MHTQWLAGGARNWDLMLCPFEPIEDDGIPSLYVPGYKWQGLHRFLSISKEWLDYDYICMPDDDLAADAATWSRFFDVCRELNARLAAPAMAPGSYFSHLVMMQNTSFRARRTTFVECGLVCMRRDTLLEALPTLRLSRLGAGVGLDLLWPCLLEHRDIWIVDETPVRHTRPVGSNYSDLYQTLFNHDLRFALGMGLQWEMRTLDGILPTGAVMSGLDPRFGDVLRAGLSHVRLSNPERAQEIDALRGGPQPPRNVAARNRLAAAAIHLQVGDATISRGKPAMVSSLSPWSWCRDRALEASGGNDGLLNGNFGFHTAEEDDPWWQVDLLGEHTIQHVLIYNRLDQRRRCLHLDIHTSLDGQQWRTIFSKRDDHEFGGIDGEPLRIEFASRRTARFVRIQAAGRTYLHLDQVEIFGERVETASAPAAPLPEPVATAPLQAEIDYVLMSRSGTILACDPERGALLHLPPEQAPFNLRLSLPEDLGRASGSLRFKAAGMDLVVQRAGAGWAIGRDGAFAAAGEDEAVAWVRDVGPHGLFNLVPAESAFIISQLGEPPAAPTARRRLLLIAPWLVVGGADKVNLDLVTGLNADFEITLVTTLGGGPWQARFAAQVERIVLLGALLAPNLHGAALAQMIRRLGIECVLLSNTQAGYASLPLLRQRFPDLPIFDLLHGEGGRHEGGGYPAASVPFDSLLTGRIVITDYLRDMMVGRYGVSSHRIRRIHNGIDTAYFAADDRDEAAIPIVSFIGRLAPEKHPEHVLEIARAMSDAIPARFVVAGEGPLGEALASMRAGMTPPVSVDLVGHVDDVRSLLRRTSVLLLTSEMEGFPIVVLEAMAMGVPVICAAVGGLPEMVRHGVDGFLVPYGPGFVTDAAALLGGLLADPHRRSAMGRSARARVLAEFGLSGMIERYRAVLTGRDRVADGAPRSLVQRGYGGEFFVQKMAVRDIAHRLPYFKSIVGGRRVLHVGCTDYPVFDPHANLHIQLKEACAVLDGLDTDRDGIEILSRYVPGKYFTHAASVEDSYDVLLVPETIEHVHNIREFLSELDTIDFEEIVITAPCLIGWNFCFNYSDRAGRLSPLLVGPEDYLEEIHPDHKAWFTPYTLANCVEQFTGWHITDIVFLDGKRMTAVHCRKTAPRPRPDRSGAIEAGRSQDDLVSSG